MGAAGAVAGVGIGLQGECIEDVLDVVFLDGGEECFFGVGVVRHVWCYGGDEGSIRVFGCDEVESLLSCGHWS